MLLPIISVVLIAFLVIGLAMPVLPLHVHQGLRLGTFMVGLVAGSQFAASLISRISAGDYADKKGAKRAVVLGLVATTLSGLFYLLSLGCLAAPGCLRDDPRDGARPQAQTRHFYACGKSTSCTPAPTRLRKPPMSRSERCSMPKCLL
jgi:MFS family permease